MQKKKKIAVIVLNYNYGRFLHQCLTSLRLQTRQPDEVIILDDCSDIEEYMEVEKFCTEDFPDYDLIRHPVNLGTSSNMTFGLEWLKLKKSPPDYVMFLGADNWLHPDYIDRTSEVLNVYRDVGIAYTDVYAVGPRAPEVSKKSAWWKGERKGNYYIWRYPEFNTLKAAQNRLGRGNFIHGSSLFRFRIVQDGAFVPSLNRFEDWRFWQQAVIVHQWMPIKVKESLLYYRQHSKNQRNFNG